MQIEVVCDEKGTVISIGRPGAVRDEPHDANVEVAVPLPGQQVHKIELPPELEMKPFLDLHNEFRVELKGGRPGFVRVKHSTKPDRKRSR